MASTNRQYKDSARFTFGGIIGIIILTLLMLLGSCATTHETSKDCCKSKKTTEKCD